MLTSKTSWGILFLFLLSSSAFAQKSIGIIAGFNVANLMRSPGVPGTTHEQRTRNAAGGMLEFGLMKSLSLHLEPMYIQKGAFFDFVDTDSPNQDELRDAVNLGYLEVPVMLKYRFIDKVTGPYLLAGPSVAYLLSARQGQKIRERDIKAERENYDFGISGGGGLFLTTDRVSMFVELRFNLGLVNIDKTAEAGSTLRNNGVRVLLGVLL